MVSLAHAPLQAAKPSAVADRVRAQAAQRPCTLVGVGVVSQTTVDAAIDLANHYETDLMLIPSRRQVDMDSLGGGYVRGWNAGRFADYVRGRDVGGHVLLCRDHGGPWQNSVEIARDLSPEAAMASAKRSYLEDIEAGFSILHLDTSVSPTGAPSQADALSRLKELYFYCAAEAEARGLPIAFEIGTEEQDSASHDPQDVLEMLAAVTAFCDDEALQRPLFVVAQTGTKVMETRNVGLDGGEALVRDLVASLKRFGVMLKQHNTDYLADDQLARHPLLGIHAANVAPEFGVVESRALVGCLEACGLTAHRDRFLEMAYACGKWDKWMLPGTDATDRDKAIIAGHYVFSTPAFLDLRAAMDRDVRAQGRHLQDHLYGAVRASIERYMTAFRLGGGA